MLFYRRAEDTAKKSWKYWSQAVVGEQSKQGDVCKEIDGFQESAPVRGIHNIYIAPPMNVKFMFQIQMICVCLFLSPNQCMFVFWNTQVK